MIRNWHLEQICRLLIGAIACSIMLVIFAGNVVGTWDNSKKFIGISGIPDVEKGLETYHAGVVADSLKNIYLLKN